MNVRYTSVNEGQEGLMRRRKKIEAYQIVLEKKRTQKIYIGFTQSIEMPVK